MKLTFIGRGGAFAPMSIGQSNMLFEENGKYMLLDCGMTAPYILTEEMGIKAQDIDAIYVSHCRADHVGGIEWLGFMNYFVGSASGNGDKRPTMFGVYEVLHGLWENSLKGGMGCIQGHVATLSTYFKVEGVQKNQSFTWQGWKFQPVQTLHVATGYSFQYSYGLLIENTKDSTKTTFITTDTQFTHPNPLQCFYDLSDTVFHDCETQYRSGVHAFYGDMKDKLDPATKEKIWLYHYNTKEDSDDGFAGWVEKGQVFVL